ncbi:tetratricopeptide repeat protein 1 [Prorops nasuta]|uniref:tetratricopeptide repeat protein 1 n=1 Tax=Prorops nasuta TaxID=863751 RepID=UPI0034CD655D
MGDDSKTVQSNEEIIEDLTRELVNSCAKLDEDATSVDNSMSNNDQTQTSDSSENILKLHNKTKESVVLFKMADSSTVDETKLLEVLKERELTLSEKEKDELRKEAEKLKNEANLLFNEGNYVDATNLYTKGLSICPLLYNKDRAILYANRAAAKSKSLPTAEKNLAVADCTKAIELDNNYVKAYIRRALLLEEIEKLDEAFEDYKKVLALDPAHTEANLAIQRLPPLIQERNEKLKEEMMGKLKDLGNLVLRPFGLSTSNFEVQKDPNSGGYSVKFNQTPKD